MHALPAQSHSDSRSCYMKPETMCSRQGNSHNRLPVYYRAHADNTTHTHPVPESSWPICFWTAGENQSIILTNTVLLISKGQGSSLMCVRPQYNPLNRCTFVSSVQTNNIQLETCKELLSYFEECPTFCSNKLRIVRW